MSTQPDEKITEEQVREANGDEPEQTPEPEPQPEPGRTPEPEPEPEPTGPTPEQMEERFKKIATAYQTYVGKVTSILEEQATELIECPLCADGVPSFVHPGDAGHLEETVKRAVQAFIGVTPEADYADDPDHTGCTACNGLGKVRTGSKVANYDLLICGRCKGSGYVPPPGVNTNGEVTSQPVLAPVGGGGGSPLDADADAWGSPRLLDNGLENPNFGRMPQYKDPTLP